MVTCTGHIGIHEGADVWTENDVMAILPNFLPSMGYQYFLSYGAPRARVFGARGAPLQEVSCNYERILFIFDSGLFELSHSVLFD